jgi:hypothetical protein
MTAGILRPAMLPDCEAAALREWEVRLSSASASSPAPGVYRWPTRIITATCDDSRFPERLGFLGSGLGKMPKVLELEFGQARQFAARTAAAQPLADRIDKPRMRLGTRMRRYEDIAV